MIVRGRTLPASTRCRSSGRPARGGMQRRVTRTVDAAKWHGWPLRDRTWRTPSVSVEAHATDEPSHHKG